jgi:hypothetical protein
MTDPEAPPRDRSQERPPGKVWLVSILLAVFGGLSLMLAMLLLSAVNNENDLPGWVYGLVFVQFLLAGLQILSGVFVWIGKAWARTIATVVCSINIAGAVLTLLSGGVLNGLVTMSVSIGLIVLLRHREVSDWLE